MKTFSIILAGGSGTRFWPMSRERSPKQVLNISGHDVMINETIKRCDGVINIADSYIVTAENQVSVIDGVMTPDVPREHILAEPAARNTAPCILYAAMKLKKEYGDGVMCIFPSDQHISDEEGFRKIIAKAAALAEKSEKLITLGIKPTFAATGYGYINFDESVQTEGAYRVNEFVEKPDYNRAVKYIESGSYLWNSGIFVWKISTIIDNFKRYLPRIYSQLEKWEEYIGTPDEKKMLGEIYPTVQKISIDFGIMERSDDVLVFPADIGWSDVGSWDALGSVIHPDEKGNIVRSDENILLDSENNVIYSENQLVSTIGIHNMIIVSTRDALMVCPKEKAQSVKDIVTELKSKDMNKYL